MTNQGYSSGVTQQNTRDGKGCKVWVGTIRHICTWAGVSSRPREAVSLRRELGEIVGDGAHNNKQRQHGQDTLLRWFVTPIR